MSYIARDLAREAARLVRGGWTQGASARNVRGQTVSPEAPDACSWCATGALDAACGRLYGSLNIYRVGIALEHVKRALAAQQWRRGIVVWNDTEGRTQAEVVALLEQAAATVHVGGAA